LPEKAPRDEPFCHEFYCSRVSCRFFHGDSAISKPGKPIFNQIHYNAAC
jgi:hypothetical protein